VTDFGLAKSLGGGPQLTSSGQVLGTPTYMAPEQARGDQACIGPHTDIYALGGILYYLLAGRPPFTGSGLMEVLYQVVELPPEPPSKFNPAIPEALEAICLKCLEKAPQDRFGSAAQVAVALTEWLAEPGAATVPTHRPGEHDTAVDAPATGGRPPAPAGQPGRGRRTAVLVAAGVLILAAAGFVVMKSLQRDGEQKVSEDRDPTKGERPGDEPSGTDKQSGTDRKPGDASKGQPATDRKPGTDKAQPIVKEVDFKDFKPEFHEFDLKVEMVGATRDKAGMIQLVEDQDVRLLLTTDRDAYVGVWNVGPDGTAVQIFPNKDDANHLVRAGEPRRVPKGEAFEAFVSGGTDRVWVIASTQYWEPPAPDAKQGPFAIFKGAAGRLKLAQTVRGIRVKQHDPKKPKPKQPPSVSETVLVFRVVPKK
jgi:hypothetical protein